MEQPLMFCHIKHAENFSVLDTKWIPKTAKFVAIGGRANATGLIKVYEMNGGQIEVVREINRKDTFKCAAFGLSRTKHSYLAIGDVGGTLQIINVDRLDGCVYTVTNAHTGIINAIDTVGGVENCGASEILTGGQDGLVKLWDPRCSEAVVQIEPTANSAHDCWAVCFANSYSNQERCVCAGYANGDIRLFDLRILRLQWESNVRNGVCSLEADHKYQPLRKLVASTTFGGINVFDFDNNSTDEHNQPTVSCISKMDADELPAIQRNHANAESTKGALASTIWCVRHLPHNRNIFATCGGSGNVRIWHNPKERPSPGSNALKIIYELSVSNKPVNCFDWSPDRAGLAVCSSFDKTLRVIASINLPLGQ